MSLPRSAFAAAVLVGLAAPAAMLATPTEAVAQTNVKTLKVGGSVTTSGGYKLQLSKTAKNPGVTTLTSTTEKSVINIDFTTDGTVLSIYGTSKRTKTSVPKPISYTSGNPNLLSIAQEIQENLALSGVFIPGFTGKELRVEGQQIDSSASVARPVSNTGPSANGRLEITNGGNTVQLTDGTTRLTLVNTKAGEGFRGIGVSNGSDYAFHVIGTPDYSKHMKEIEAVANASGQPLPEWARDPLSQDISGGVVSNPLYAGNFEIAPTQNGIAVGNGAVAYYVGYDGRVGLGEPGRGYKEITDPERALDALDSVRSFMDGFVRGLRTQADRNSVNLGARQRGSEAGSSLLGIFIKKRKINQVLRNVDRSSGIENIRRDRLGRLDAQDVATWVQSMRPTIDSAAGYQAGIKRDGRQGERQDDRTAQEFAEAAARATPNPNDRAMKVDGNWYVCFTNRLGATTCNLPQVYINNNRR